MMVLYLQATTAGASRQSFPLESASGNLDVSALDKLG